MEIWLSVILGLVLIIAVYLLCRVLSMHRSARELSREISEIMDTDTNSLIRVSTGDGAIRELAAKLNTELRTLRSERHRFEQGDEELKAAITNIAHDLRTPLTAISGYLQLLEREEMSEDAERYASMIENRTDALKNLTEELFRYSIIVSEKEPEPERVVLNDVLEESLAAAYGALTGRGIEPVVEISEKKVERLLNRSALSRIFENIIANAAKYSDGDFAVTLRENGTAEFRNSAARLGCVEAGKLFDRFYTVETGRNSTGLGLSIAKLLTERMGGSIGAGYEAGELKITVTFPEEARA